jgi:hypothetical protein
MFQDRELTIPNSTKCQIPENTLYQNSEEMGKDASHMDLGIHL